MRKKTELIFSILTIVLVSFAVISLTVKNIKLREQIYRERLEYTEEYCDDLIEMLEDYYENEVAWLEDYYKNEIRSLEKYYETKIELLDKDTLTVYQVIEDLDDVMEWTIRYYEVESKALRDAMALEEYIFWKDPVLYDRLLNY